MRTFAILFLTGLFFFQAQAQKVTQTVRGVVRDLDSRSGLIGAHVQVLNSDPLIGTITDLDGNFVLEEVPAGRINIRVTYLGYEEKVIPNIQVGGGKQVVLEIDLRESLVMLKAAEVTATKDKSEVLNEMALISARTFSVEETKRYAGSFNDPARMVSSYAGVTGDAQGDNDIIVRGNSPKGILWRLEGVEIPNPNHFASEGETGGPINALNSAMLANSDFYTGAFAPEYGNAYSGVFDMKLRTGNNEEREYSVSAGVIGIDATVEGPFAKGGKSSYLANYRYSSLAILDNLGLVDFQGIPKYQDGSFKLMFPTKNAGIFSVFGLGGKSNIFQQDQDEDNENLIHANSNYKAGMGVAGINHFFPINENSYLRNTFSGSTNGSGFDYKELKDGELELKYDDYLNKYTWRMASTFNTKLNARHKLQIGAIYSLHQFDFRSRYFDEDKGGMANLLDQSGNAGQLQAFTSWKFRIAEQLTLVSGVHYMQFMMNNTNSIEPRTALKWQLTEKQSLNAGFGIHSKLESLTTYFSIDSLGRKPNRDIDFGKAAHYVLSYENLLHKNLLAKAEVYYQHLYHIPVANSLDNPFSLINSSEGFTNFPLVNEGGGRNYGLELTLERYFTKRYFFLATASLYNSEYKALDGKWRQSVFNGNYVGNLLFGKEFSLGDHSKNRTLGISGKITAAGGKNHTPVNMEASVHKGETVRDENNYLGAKAEDLFMANLVVYYRKERNALPMNSASMCRT
ncbi:MAG: TonB-dependent receptor [Bacteroidia bacterium]